MLVSMSLTGNRRVVQLRQLAAVLLMVAALFSGTALAYYPHAGDRATDLYGRNVVGGDVVHLEDYLGKWVWVEFWSPG